MPTITLSPKPPTQGQPATITFTGGTNPQTLDIEWVPPGAGPATITTNDAGQATLTIPSNATAMTISGGGAQAESSSIKIA